MYHDPSGGIYRILLSPENDSDTRESEEGDSIHGHGMGSGQLSRKGWYE